MARKYSEKSLVSMDSGKDPMPMEKKHVMLGCTPTNDNMMINSEWDSLEGMDKAIRNSLAGISKKRI